VHSQRGFMLYGLAVAVMVAGALGVALVVQSARLDSAKARLDSCRADYEIAMKSIEKQNKAVSDLQEAAKKAKERARIASEKAAKARVASKSEIERLEALARNPAPKGDCPAGQAVQEVRKGMKK
jgi:Tfp pilus assembly protein PilE